ncbi:arylesterase [Roseivirga pacifica]|uniref:arylesterase n=1 Tax=Roseivirga pacifica TaxID=1267423 RepID=UPI0020963203|nr:arylesterase [Roseivirga pacifica]MCO6359619.1 arylesterase [Roseivirga pacifica]MCO6366989.1 arylesterase [Roseivirga pacifica]MCO6370479.1 arylesterase [Roseivirga pacifica]MCO6374646.1 arylesterase [Roseivirga pacifica]MCO6379904.1 arylesterase [Roseivirga pacifica]
MNFKQEMFRTLTSVLVSITLISSILTKTQNEKQTIVFFGDSITAGYGITTENAFPALIDQKLQSEGLNYTAINAGLSGETSMGGLNRIDWILRSKPAILMLELGGNDGLRGLSLEETEKNLKAIIDKVRTANADTKIILAGMQIPPNLGQDYTTQFKNLFPKVAKDKDVAFIPFLLENVGGDKNLNLSDGIHPNEEGHKIVAETVWEALKPLL